jgi:hypothetical protein
MPNLLFKLVPGHFQSQIIKPELPSAYLPGWTKNTGIRAPGPGYVGRKLLVSSFSVSCLGPSDKADLLSIRFANLTSVGNDSGNVGVLQTMVDEQSIRTEQILKIRLVREMRRPRWQTKQIPGNTEVNAFAQLVSENWETAD